MNELISYFKSQDRNKRKAIINIFISYCLILFTYPFFRVASTTLFFDTYGAKFSPHAWVSSILLISGTIFIFNRTLKKYGVHKLFQFFSLIVMALFLLASFSYQLFHFKQLGFFLFVLKEAYIVIVVHLIIGYCNNFFSEKEVKLLYGPLGGFSSLAASVGGFVTANLSRLIGVENIFYPGIFFFLISIYFFKQTPIMGQKKSEESEKRNPLAAISDIKEYALLIALIIAISQFIITIVEMKFNLSFETLVPNSEQRSEKLGYIYSIINIVSVVVQFVVIPFVATRFSNKAICYFIPLFYLLSYVTGIGMGVGMVYAVAGTFILFKGIDYSLFAIAKEVLYQKLNSMQKYGAKYIADMFSYRTSKAVISIFLIGFQSPDLLNVLVYSFLIAWMICLYLIFYFQRKYFQ